MANSERRIEEDKRGTAVYSSSAIRHSPFAIRPMSWTTAVAIYFIIWWVVLFAVLPWGVRSQAESGDVVPGSDPGAPAIPHLGAKLIWTTLVASVVFALTALAYINRLVTLDDLATLFGLLP